MTWEGLLLQGELKNKTAIFMGVSGMMGGGRSARTAVPPDPLTRREQEVALRVGRGLTSRHIASELSLSKRTVENHVGKILKKLGFASRAQIAAWVAQR